MCLKVRPRFRQQRALAEPAEPEAARAMADMGRVEAEAQVEEMPATAAGAQVAADRWAPQWAQPELEAVEDPAGALVSVAAFPARVAASAAAFPAESREDIRAVAVRLGTDPVPAGEVECPACPLSSPESAARRDLPASSS